MEKATATLKKAVALRQPRYFWNGLFGHITLIVLLGIGMLSVTISTVVLAMSHSAFTETYGKSQQRVFDEIEKSLIDLNNHLHDIVNAIDSSWAFRLYFNSDDDGKLDNVQNFQNIYQMEQDLEQSKASELVRPSILVLGMNGKHYLSRTETISQSDRDILESQPVQNAMNNVDALHYTYEKGAYTATSQNVDVVVVSKALYYHENKNIYAIVLVTLTDAYIREYYDYFVTDYSMFYMVSDEGIVMSSNDREKTGRVLETQWYQDAARKESVGRWITQIDNKSYTIMKQDLPYLGCSIYGLIDNDKALDNLYNMPLLILLCVLIGIITLALCLMIARRTLNPLSQLVDKMSFVRDGEFTQYMPVSGTEEIKELAVTYNIMLDDIKKYIDQLIQTQKEQRQSEIKALQMQINPHYIYNTLASIKWLVYQNNQEKTVKTIDAFIQLLRNTISNSDEFITVDKELENLHHYVSINQTRYGDAVQVEYYVSPDCGNCLLPKMILQPFIENAFFHAFPSGMCGTIEIFIKRRDSILEIKVADDGVGMDSDTATRAVGQDLSKEHYSGIGVHNVHERLQLLYGEDYGIQIESRKQRGTCVKISLPVRKMDK
jgi:two-component system sensor histidine kinase YesM